jgi:hypothetical protein
MAPRSRTRGRCGQTDTSCPRPLAAARHHPGYWPMLTAAAERRDPHDPARAVQARPVPSTATTFGRTSGVDFGAATSAALVAAGVRRDEVVMERAPTPGSCWRRLVVASGDRTRVTGDDPLDSTTTTAAAMERGRGGTCNGRRRAHDGRLRSSMSRSTSRRSRATSRCSGGFTV